MRLQHEVRPELWGAYARVLNRLQGCIGELQCELRPLLLALLVQLEAAVQGRKGPGASGAGAAFVKGKEIVMSVVKRYRRRLGGSTGGLPQPSPGAGRRAAFGVAAGGLLLALPLMVLAAGGSGSSSGFGAAPRAL